MIPHGPASRAVICRHPRGRRERVVSCLTIFSGVHFRFRPRLELMEVRTLLSTFLVNTTADSGAGSLRQAILDSNNAVGATNTIDFDISGTGVHTIAPLSSLPAITNSVLIDGFSQPGYAGTPLIELSGSQVRNADGLDILGSGVTVRGLDVNNFNWGAGIYLTGTSAAGDWIYGNLLGNDPTGTKAEPNEYGVEIDGGATDNLVGTNGNGANHQTERNLLSGNSYAGVWITGQSTDGNVVAGNDIGTDASATAALGNKNDGVEIDSGAGDNTVGGTTAGSANVISGNTNDGVETSGSGTSGNVVQGNYIGTDLTGTTALDSNGYPLGNNNDGVEIDSGASEDSIGGTTAGSANVISGNTNDGVEVSGSGTSGNVVQGNYIGTDLTGTTASGSNGFTLGNNNDGVEIDSGASNNSVGGTTLGAGNVISGDGHDGVEISGSGTSGNVVQGDYVGTDTTGTTASDSNGVPLGNNNDGVEIDSGASDNTIGGTVAGAGDVISGNGNLFGVEFMLTGRDGVQIDKSDHNVVAGDKIGTDATGTAALGNSRDGVEIDSSSGNTIGGTIAGASDVISGNGNSNSPGPVLAGGSNDGVYIDESEENVIAGDTIGTDVTGTAALGNSGDGVEIDSSSGNTIGGTVAGAADVISGNGSPDFLGPANPGTSYDGVQIDESDDNVIAGDRIGTDVRGTAALGNSGDGVEIDSSSGNTIGGTVAGAADVISGNGSSNPNGSSPSGSGVVLDASSHNLVEGDRIGADATGVIAMPNQTGGIEIESGSNDNTIGGATAAAGNLITDNGGPGVVVGFSADDNSVGNEITADRIFGNSGQAIDLGDDGVTDNGDGPRQGPNDLQNFPIFVATASGQLQGWLGGSLPDTTFRIDLFASAGYGPGGSGEAEDFLGSVEVRTDSTGRVVFTVPFTAPAGLPIVTATATDSNGNTSEVTVQRQGNLEVPNQTIRLAPNQPVIFSVASGDRIALQDPDVGPLVPAWALTLSVPAGALTLFTTAGLAGFGDGSQSLSYSGALSALNAALDGMTLTLPPGFQGKLTLTLDAQSYGATPIQTQVSIVLTSGRFEVTTTADSGPGSLRQAILESNLANGGTNAIDFAIPGAGVQTVVAASPLPAITNPVVIDGTTQPGYAGAPLIAIAGQGTGNADPLSVGSDVKIKGLSIGGSSFTNVSSSTMLTVESVPLSQAQGGIVTYQIVVAAGEELLATVQELGTTTGLSLLDAEGHIVMQSDGLSAEEPIDTIDTYIAPGTYSLQVQDTGGNGSFTLTTMMMPSAAPLEPIPVGSYPIAIVTGDFSGNGIFDLAVANEQSGIISILMANGDGSFQPAVNYGIGGYQGGPGAMVAGDFSGNGILDLAVAGADGIQILLGNGDGTFQPATTVAVGIGGPLVAGEFGGNGILDLAVANQNPSGPGTVSILMGNGDGTFRPPVNYDVGNGSDAIVAGDFSGTGILDFGRREFLRQRRLDLDGQW